MFLFSAATESQPLGSSKTRAGLFLPTQLDVCLDTTVTSDQLPPPQSKSPGWFLTAIFYFPFPDLEQICPFAFPHHCFFFSHWSLCLLDICSQMLSPRLCPGTRLRSWVTSGLCPSSHLVSRIVKGLGFKNLVGGRPYSILSPGDGSALFSGCPAPAAGCSRGTTSTQIPDVATTVSL